MNEFKYSDDFEMAALSMGAIFHFFLLLLDFCCALGWGFLFCFVCVVVFCVFVFVASSSVTLLSCSFQSLYPSHTQIGMLHPLGRRSTGSLSMSGHGGATCQRGLALLMGYFGGVLWRLF